jgi:hypothetical protein
LFVSMLEHGTTHRGMCRKGNTTHLVCVPKPCRSLLLTADQRDPFAAASTKSFPHVEVAFGSASVLWSLECSAGSSTDTVCKRLVVPESAVLEHEPTSWLAKSAPPFALVAMTPDPSWSIEITLEAQVLLMWHEIRVRGIHVGLWRIGRLFVQRRVQVRRV